MSVETELRVPGLGFEVELRLGMGERDMIGPLYLSHTSTTKLEQKLKVKCGGCVGVKRENFIFIQDTPSLRSGVMCIAC